ncbi:MAG TPA: hypothetical protein VNG12_08215 [Acidimicrobiales bacterium]|nr:hypothetical protein [Candidatus Saccharimonadales bacterium]HVA06707.1 hypothetical protein [Acidimicrobiales bacterium]
MGWPSRSAPERSTEVLFATGPRIDASRKRPNEGIYEFLDRSAKPLFGEVRRVLNEWLAGLPEEAPRELVPRLRSNDQAFESAFWELYLYTAYIRSGYRVTVHPQIAGSTNHPDFMVDGNGTRFYLEAVRVGTAAADVAAERRLQDLKAALARQHHDRFELSMLYWEIGPAPLPTNALLHRIDSWLSSLDPDALFEALSHGSIFDNAPRFPWRRDGWRLEFQAIPLAADAIGDSQSLVVMSGPGEAQVVDNPTGVLRVLDSKANRYGSMGHPLVIAVMSNTEYPTEDYEFEKALFGLAVGRRVDSIRDPSLVRIDGHWLTRHGWRRGHTPQVIAASCLKPWLITQVHPRLWTTLEPDVAAPSQPDWLSGVHIGEDGTSVELGSSLETLFGLPPGWGG